MFYSSTKLHTKRENISFASEVPRINRTLKTGPCLAQRKGSGGGGSLGTVPDEKREEVGNECPFPASY